jgi:NTP pyrophosphatase (non-canonical NTP hydrolase)
MSDLDQAAEAFARVVDPLAEQCHNASKNNGFWPEEELDQLALTERIIEAWVDGGRQALTTEEEVRSFVTDVVSLSRETAPANVGEKVALIEGELGELIEAYRAGDPQSDKIPEFRHSEEEAADTIIRTLDLAAHEGMRLGEAIKAKIKYNASRPRKHGKRF